MPPRLVCVTPVMPHPGGGGLAMRAAMTLAALARLFDVELLVVPVAGTAGEPSDFIRRHTTRAHVLDLANRLDPYSGLVARLKDAAERQAAERRNPRPLLSRHCTADTARFLLDWCGERPAALHVMRLYLAPLAEPFLRLPKADRPFCVLDLDDDEVRTRLRLADLHRACGDAEAAEREALEATRYRTLAQRAVPAFDRVTLSAAHDAERLAAAFPPGRFAVVPNGYPPGRPKATRPRTDGPLRLLFVGSLDYFPNADAVRSLCSEIRGALAASADRPVEIDIVGGGAVSSEVAGIPGVRLAGRVDCLRPYYEAADVAVVPIRAGGGTRIKILEAFARHVPVVSTTLGAEGLEAVDGVHLLIADGADAFARACWRLKSSPTLAEGLTRRAADLQATRYDAEAIGRAVATLYRPVIDRR